MVRLKRGEAGVAQTCRERDPPQKRGEGGSAVSHGGRDGRGSEGSTAEAAPVPVLGAEPGGSTVPILPEIDWQRTRISGSFPFPGWWAASFDDTLRIARMFYIVNKSTVQVFAYVRGRDAAYGHDATRPACASSRSLSTAGGACAGTGTSDCSTTADAPADSRERSDCRAAAAGADSTD